MKVTMCHDKFRREPVATKITGSLGMIDPYGEILVHLKMQMRRIHPMVVADGADLLTSCDLLSLTNNYLVEMRREGVGEIEFPILNPGMADDHNIAPARMDIPSENDDSIADRIDGIAESLGTSTIRHPILSQMSSRAESPRLVISVGIGGIHRQIKSVSGMG